MTPGQKDNIIHLQTYSTGQEEADNARVKVNAGVGKVEADKLPNLREMTERVAEALKNLLNDNFQVK